LQLITTGGFKF